MAYSQFKDDDGSVWAAHDGPDEDFKDFYPPDHQLGTQVPKGGSMCANCQYLADPQTCGNDGFIAWNGGTGQLPAPADEYCCDLYEPGQQGGQQPQQPGQGPQQGPSGSPQDIIKALQG